MIIKQERVQSSSLGSLKNHVLDLKSQPENDSVKIVHGDLDILEDWSANAAGWSRKYSVRHFVINPEIDVDDSDRDKVLKLIFGEYGIHSRDCVVIKHVKKKSDHPHAGIFTC